VLAFTFTLAVVTGVLFGLAPALRTSRPDVHEELKGGAGSSISPGKRRRFTSNVLVAGEMALSMLLLVSAGLLLEDFARLRNMDIGVRPEGVFTAAVRLPETQYKTGEQKLEFSQSLLEKCAHIPAWTRPPQARACRSKGAATTMSSCAGRPPRRATCWWNPTR
jgi:putative ABC transport system permease protein